MAGAGGLAGGGRAPRARGETAARRGAGVRACGRPAGCMARCERLCGAALRDVLGRAQGVLFDCDGVLWNGERVVPGAPELVERLAQAGKAALFVSNNSRRARPELALRFARLGFGGLRPDQLFSSALCAARLLGQRLDAPGPVFVLGGEGLRSELRAAGLRVAGDPGGDPGAAPRVRAVLVGYDEHFSFARLSEACAHLRDPDCLLVATDRDPWHPLSDGSRTPGEREGGGVGGGPGSLSLLCLEVCLQVTDGVGDGRIAKAQLPPPERAHGAFVSRSGHSCSGHAGREGQRRRPRLAETRYPSSPPHPSGASLGGSHRSVSPAMGVRLEICGPNPEGSSCCGPAGTPWPAAGVQEQGSWLEFDPSPAPAPARAPGLGNLVGLRNLSVSPG